MTEHILVYLLALDYSLSISVGVVWYEQITCSCVETMLCKSKYMHASNEGLKKFKYIQTHFEHKCNHARIHNRVPSVQLRLCVAAALATAAPGALGMYYCYTR